MMKTTVALSALLAVGAAGGALAQEQIEEPAISGTIQSVDPTSRTVVLDNGQSYTMGESANMESLQQGDEVDLSCDAAGTNCMAVTADATPQNDEGPETETQPSAGGTQEDTDSGAAGTDLTPPGNTPPESTSPDGGAGTDGGGMSGSGSSGSGSN
jgi:hypothetical protein